MLFIFSISIFDRTLLLRIAEKIFNFGKSGKAGKALNLSYKSILEYSLAELSSISQFFNVSFFVTVILPHPFDSY